MLPNGSNVKGCVKIILLGLAHEHDCTRTVREESEKLCKRV